jgi:hypothetical protein
MKYVSKSIRSSNSIATYSSGCKQRYNKAEDKWEVIEQTEKEQEQDIFKRMQEHARREMFNENMKSLIENYLKRDGINNFGEFDNIHIKVSYENGGECTMNIRNEKLMWEKAKKAFAEQ